MTSVDSVKKVRVIRPEPHKNYIDYTAEVHVSVVCTKCEKVHKKAYRLDNLRILEGLFAKACEVVEVWNSENSC